MEKIFDDYKRRLRHLKKKSYRENMEGYKAENEAFYQDLLKSVNEASDKDEKASQIAEDMFKAAINAAKAINYEGLGTVEFLFDGKDFYFMEMNTRIQVEHGVTEMCTGTDLIIEQIRVADGLPLSFTQADICPKGHAIECRINAEIPSKNFMPCPGTVKNLHLPAGNGVRVDSGLYSGYRSPSAYDSMIGKIIVHAPDRAAALRKMSAAVDETVITGVETNLDFLYQILRHPVFEQGEADTGFIADYMRM